MSPVITWFVQALLFLLVPVQTPAEVTVVCSYWDHQASRASWDIVGYTATGAGPLPLVITSANETSPFPFPKQRAFGYMVEHDERGSLFKYNMVTGQNLDLGIEIQAGATCEVSPDGNRLACSDKVDDFCEIVVIDLATRAREVITRHSANAFGPSWSPDGRKLAYWIESSDTGELRVADTLVTEGDHLSIYDFETKHDNLLTNTSGVSDQSPRWSPDGQWIAFARMGDDAWNVWMVKPDGTGTVQLTTGAREDSFPAWSPDGRTILFQSYRSGNGRYFDLYSVDVATKNVARFSKTDRSDEQKPVFIAR